MRVSGPSGIKGQSEVGEPPKRDPRERLQGELAACVVVDGLPDPDLSDCEAGQVPL